MNNELNLDDINLITEALHLSVDHFRLMPPGAGRWTEKDIQQAKEWVDRYEEKVNKVIHKLLN